MESKPRSGLCAALKPSDERCSATFIGFVAQKAEGRWARDAEKQT